MLARSGPVQFGSPNLVGECLRVGSLYGAASLPSGDLSLPSAVALALDLEDGTMVH